MKRNVRGYDPAVQNAIAKVKDLEQALAQLWKRRKPLIAITLARANTDDVVRQAEIELRTLTAKEAAFRDSLVQIKQERLTKARLTRAQVIASGGPEDSRIRLLDEHIARLERTSSDVDDFHSQGTARAQTLIGSIEQGLQAVESLRERIGKQFEKDMNEAKSAEIGMLSESNLRHSLERQRALYNSVLDQLRKAQLVSDYGSITAQVLNPPSVIANAPKRAFNRGHGPSAGGRPGGWHCVRVRTSFDHANPLADGDAAGPEPVRAWRDPVAEPRTARDLRGMDIGLICHAPPRSFISEAYKSIRTNLEYLLDGARTPRSFWSPAPSRATARARRPATWRSAWPTPGGGSSWSTRT